MSHGDKVSKLPKSFSVIASTPNAKYAAIADEDKKFMAYSSILKLYIL